MICNDFSLNNDEILKNAKYYVNKGKFFYNKNQIENAFSCFNMSLRISPNFYEAHLAKGEAFMGLMKIEDAVKSLKECLLINECYRILIDLAECYNLLAEYNTAIEYCDKAFNLDKTNYLIPYKKGRILYNIKRYNNALEAYNKCLKINPNHYDSYFDKGEILYMQNKYTDAQYCYEQAIFINKNRPDAYIGLSLLFTQLGNIEKSFSYAKKALSLDPTDEWVKCHYNVTKNLLYRNM
ncbi:tetratricopeptide repeat protein [Clostridium sp. DL1XJH146]